MKNSRADRLASVPEEDVERIVRMALEDRTPFELIEAQFGLKPDDVVVFMRQHLKRPSFLRWRQRAHERGQLKNPKHSGLRADRFKSPNQRVDGTIKENRRSRR
jgi:uncharacterized protein (TIGR03643 family)